ncbi:MAG TPA: glycosyltransferase [Methylophilaceae bacterium]|nr:glycosyltransferase [Methylophilaceae bacterium]
MGGAEQHLVQVACQLKERGWNPELYAFTTGGPLSSRLQEAKIPVFGLSPAWMNSFPCKRLVARFRLVATFAFLAWIMLVRRPALVHFFLPGAYIVGGIVSLFTFTRPRVMSRRSRNFYQRKHPYMTKLELFLHGHMDAVCGNSLAVVNDLKLEGVEANKLHLIYNGIDLKRFLQHAALNSLRQKLEIDENALVFICIANLIPYKGHRDLLDALAEARPLLPQPWVCLCVGRDDGIGADLRALAAELGIGDNVRWLGGRSDIPDLLSCADVGILCSHEEGFSNAVLEGMAAKLPMIVTDVGGNAEAVLDRITGRVVPPRQPAQLAQAILEMASDPTRGEMGKLGRERVSENFSLTSCVTQYEALYDQTLRPSSFERPS